MFLESRMHSKSLKTRYYCRNQEVSRTCDTHSDYFYRVIYQTRNGPCGVLSLSSSCAVNFISVSIFTHFEIMTFSCTGAISQAFTRNSTFLAVPSAPPSSDSYESPEQNSTHRRPRPCKTQVGFEKSHVRDKFIKNLKAHIDRSYNFKHDRSQS